MENTTATDLTLFGTTFFDSHALLELVLRLAMDLGLVTLLVFGIYRARVEDSQGYVFTFFTFNLVVFFICYLLAAVDLSTGFGFGLFALFSILRYRTVTINIREMSFLFVVISLGIINSIQYKSLSWVELIFIDLAITIAVIFLHWLVYKDNLDSLLIRYEKIELLQPARREELLADLRKRTGMDVRYVRIESLSFVTDSADIRIFIPKKSIPTYASEQ